MTRSVALWNCSNCGMAATPASHSRVRSGSVLTRVHDRNGVAADLDRRMRVGQQVAVPGGVVVPAAVGREHDPVVAVAQVGHRRHPCGAGGGARRGQQQERRGLEAGDLTLVPARNWAMTAAFAAMRASFVLMASA